jgi:hypothetical protein
MVYGFLLNSQKLLRKKWFMGFLLNGQKLLMTLQASSSPTLINTNTLKLSSATTTKTNCLFAY